MGVKAAKGGAISRRQMVGGESARTRVEEVMSALVADWGERRRGLTVGGNSCVSH